MSLRLVYCVSHDTGEFRVMTTGVPEIPPKAQTPAKIGQVIYLMDVHYKVLYSKLAKPSVSLKFVVIWTSSDSTPSPPVS
jgi:hypothetical protein